MSFDASKWPWKVPNLNFPNWDLPLKWPCKLIPPIFSTMKGSRQMTNNIMIHSGSRIINLYGSYSDRKPFWKGLRDYGVFLGDSQVGGGLS
jgi:hypothetical protein